METKGPDIRTIPVHCAPGKAPWGHASERKKMVSVRQMVRAVSAVLDCSVPPSGPHLGSRPRRARLNPAPCPDARTIGFAE